VAITSEFYDADYAESKPVSKPTTKDQADFNPWLKKD